MKSMKKKEQLIYVYIVLIFFLDILNDRVLFAKNIVNIPKSISVKTKLINPIITTADLNDIWGVKNDIYIVGDRGTIINIMNYHWKTIDNNYFDFNFKSIWGASKSDIFIVGHNRKSNSTDGIILHYNGSSLTQMVLPFKTNLNAVWGFKNDNIYAVGNNYILHYDGKKWLKEVYMENGFKFNDIWGNSKNDIIAITEKGNVMKYDGKSWTELNTPLKETCARYPLRYCCKRIWGNKNNYYISSRNFIYNFNGHSWKEISIPGIKSNIYGIWGGTDNEIIAGSCNNIHFYDYYSDNWTKKLSTVWNSKLIVNNFWSDNDHLKYIYAVGSGGVILKYDGRTWENLSGFNILNFRSIWGSSPYNIYALNMKGEIFHFDGSKWKIVLNTQSTIIYKLKGISSSDIFAVGSYGKAYYFKDAKLKQIDIKDNKATFYDVWGDSPDNVFLVGDKIYHYDGVKGSKIESPLDSNSCLRAIWGASGKNIYAVGSIYIKKNKYNNAKYSSSKLPNYEGVIIHYNGESWSKLKLPYMIHGPLNGIWGNSEDNIYVVGDAGIIIHFDGKEWNRIRSKSRENLHSVWGTSSDNVFAINENFTSLYFYNGKLCKKFEIPFYSNLTGNYATIRFNNHLWGSSLKNIYAAGPLGTIIHFDISSETIDILETNDKKYNTKIKKVSPSILDKPTLMSRNVKKPHKKNSQLINPIKQVALKDYKKLSKNEDNNEINPITNKGKMQTLPELKEKVTNFFFPKSKTWAVIIGIKDYSKEKNGFDKLPYAINDAEDFSDSLTINFDIPKERIFSLINTEATKSKIEQLLGSLSQNSEIDTNDRFIFYFSGHGFTVTTKNKTKHGYLIPYDGKDTNLYSTCISMATINEIKNLIPTKQILIVIDACYSGIVGHHVYNKNKNTINSKIKKELTKETIEIYTENNCYQILTSGKSNQTAKMGPKWDNHSVFTYYLLIGLKGDADTNDDTIITLYELYNYVERNVRSDTLQQQHPQIFDGVSECQFIFYSEKEM